MSLSKALSFVRRAAGDAGQREQCYHAESRSSLLNTLGFSDEEFEEAIRMKLVQCQSEEDAALVQELKFWFLLL